MCIVIKGGPTALIKFQGKIRKLGYKHQVEFSEADNHIPRKEEVLIIFKDSSSGFFENVADNISEPVEHRFSVPKDQARILKILKDLPRKSVPISFMHYPIYIGKKEMLIGCQRFTKQQLRTVRDLLANPEIQAEFKFQKTPFTLENAEEILRLWK